MVKRKAFCKFTKKAMVIGVVSWNGVSKPFFVGGSNLKSNSKSYVKHLRNDLTPAVKELYPNNNFIFIQIVLHLIAQRLFRTFYEKNWNPDLLLYGMATLFSWLQFIRILLLEWGKKKCIEVTMLNLLRIKKCCKTGSLCVGSVCWKSWTAS